MYRFAVTVLAIAGLVSSPCRAGELGDYLTQDGKLKEAIRLETGSIEFLAPPGRVWTIEPSGDWSEKHSEAKGKLSAKQLVALAQHLATQDLSTLPHLQGYQSTGADGAARGGYEFVVIAFGKKKAVFNTRIGDSRNDYLPKPGDPKAAAWSRFIALELILGDMLLKSEFKEEPRK